MLENVSRGVNPLLRDTAPLGSYPERLDSIVGDLLALEEAVEELGLTRNRLNLGGQRHSLREGLGCCGHALTQSQGQQSLRATDGRRLEQAQADIHCGVKGNLQPELEHAARPEHPEVGFLPSLAEVVDTQR